MFYDLIKGGYKKYQSSGWLFKAHLYGVSEKLRVVGDLRHPSDRLAPGAPQCDVMRRQRLRDELQRRVPHLASPDALLVVSQA